MTIDVALAALNREWRELVTTTAPAVAGWGNRYPQLASAVDLEEVLSLIADSPDAVLGALLRLGAEGDVLAWRTVLQAMLGKAVRLAKGKPGRLSEAISELWVVIGDYPLDRRPASIAVNLSWELKRRLTEMPLRLLPTATPRSEPSAADTLAEAHQLGLIDTQTLRTLQLVYVDGLTSAQAAELLGISAELVRYRCSRNLRRLAGQAELLAS